MTNIYVFYKGNTAPSGWTRTTSYDGKYARCGSTHGTTSGNSSHTHTLSSYTVGTCGIRTIYTGGVNFAVAHAGHGLSLSSCGAENNDPPYYTLSLIYMDESTFVNSTKAFPADVIVASRASISHSNFTRDSDLDSKFIKLGDYGSTGGRTATTAGHACSFSLTSYTPSSVQSGDPFGGSLGSWKSAAHTHTCSETSTTATTLPKKVATRLYRTTATTSSIPVDVVCFFDGTPSSVWTSLSSSWTGCCIYGANSDPTIDGSDTHTHNNLSMTSSAGGTNNAASTAPVVNACISDHTHSVSATLSSGNHLPPSVDLVPYYLNTQIVPQQTLDKTCDVDIVMKKVQAKTADVDIVLKKRDINKTADVDLLLKKAQALTWTADLVVKKAQTSTYEIDLLQRKALGLDYGADLLARKALDSTYEMDLQVKTVQDLGYDMDLQVKKPLALDYEADLLVRKALDSTYDMDMLMKKGLDATHELGLLLKKRDLEATYQTNMVLISGNKIEYNAGIKIIKALNFTYTAGLLARKALDFTYDMGMQVEKALELGYNMDIDLERVLDTTANMDILLKKQVSQDYAADILLLKEGVEMDYGASLSLARFVHRKYDINLFMKKGFNLDYGARIFLTNRLTTTYPAGLIMRKALQTLYYAGLGIKRANDKTYPADLIMRKALQTLYYAGLGIKRANDKTYAADLLLEGQSDFTYSMDMSIYSLSLIHYAIDMRIWGPRTVHYGMKMKAKKGGIESGYGAQIKIILPSQKPRKLRPTDRQVPTVILQPDGSPYSPTGDIQFQRVLRPGKSQI